MTDGDLIEKYNKPGFDARLKFTDQLANWWDMIRLAQIQGDYDTWVKALRGMFSFTQPFIKDSTKVKLAMDATYVAQKNYFVRRGSKAGFIFEQKYVRTLYDWQDELFNATKHLNLPLAAEDLEEMDEQDFLAKSKAR